MRSIWKIGLLLALLFPGARIFAAGTSNLALVPLQQHIQQMDGSFTLTPQTRICADRASRQTAAFFAERLRQSTGDPLKAHRQFSSAPAQNSILFTTKDANTNVGSEGYELEVTTNAIVIRAPAQAGLFYGGQTLMQLVLHEPGAWQAPCVKITDWPRFPWRGFMLDVSRHFFNKSEVETILDEMAQYKLNRFHWHLVDDQGWRIEVKKYPRLTEIGAWRRHDQIEPSETNAPSADKFGPDGRYGGFYTQHDIREIVAYAAVRHIMVVPEIEMPGHSEAALTAYPQFSCFGGPYTTDANLSIHDSIYDPSNAGTFAFLQNVLTEVFKLFPAPYVHIGGDEVRKDYWDRSAACLALMKREGFANEDELQSYFIKRMEKFVDAHGKILVGWSEILKGGLATNAVVMDWIGGGKQAAESGHDAVMTPIDYCYLDHYHKPGAPDIYTPMQKVYSFDPVPADLPAPLQSHILGTEGVLWTEYIASFPQAQRVVFPRECAIAEIAWSAKEERNWADFQRRIGQIRQISPITEDLRK
ncbi:MAG TPA: beta-N-acetylhexosaminidase [Verrucomicrobiae bacterium]|nr:beta-N-acetylhexosaminidase [Verrucomicrobiae bacterium]